MSNIDVHFSSKSNEWGTPQELFDKLNCIFSFTLDVASTHENTKCEKHFTIEDDGLSQSWSGETFWMNPPYGREISKWVKKAYESSLIPGTAGVILVPSRTDTSWWHNYCMKGDIYFVRGRLKFENDTLSKPQSAPFPSAIIKFDFENKFKDWKTWIS